jgi:hypothetical protein
MDDHANPEWMLIEADFIYVARTGEWREHAQIDGVTRDCGWPGRGHAIIVDGASIRRKDLADRFPEAWREYAEPGMRHMLEPAPVLAASEIVDASLSASGRIECVVRPRNIDLITTPLVSPWAEQWAFTIHESSGRIVRAASYLGGEIVVEHELTTRK